jgi:hypothetical protein
MRVQKRAALGRPWASAVLGEAAPLAYSGGGDPDADYLAAVRAGSAVRRWAGRLAVVQDDVNVLALRDPQGEVRPRLLPWGEGRRRRFDDSLGNKSAKLDLEAGLVLPDGRFLALGSGSTGRRERIAIAWPDGRVALRDGAELYRMLRAARDFSGSELNIEGAIVAGESLRLFQRGNGAPRGDLEPVNATADLDLADWVRWLDGQGPVPPLGSIVQYDLGQVAGVRLGFTDAAALPSGAVVFLAGAEASADASSDGAVAGCRVGSIEGETVWTCPILDRAGRPIALKLEGIEPIESPGPGLLRFVVVADLDSPEVPALIATLDLRPGGPQAAGV